MRSTVFLFFAALITLGNPAVHADRPNILLIVTDDLGWGDLGVNWQNQRGSLKHHRTPNLDAMASRGVNLRRHYCGAPVCASSRSTLLTGVHQGNAVIRDNQFDRALEDNHTLATVLSSAGYRTILVGKYGLQGLINNRESDDAGSPEAWQAYPTKRGFDDFFGYVRHRDGHQHYPDDNWPMGNTESHRTGKQLWHNDREISDQAGGCYTTDLFTAYAKKTIIESSRDEQPFFLMLTYDTPHAALQLPPTAYPSGDGVDGGVKWIGEPGELINAAGQDIDSYRHPDYVGHGWSDVEERFATSVRRIDDCIGDLTATLRDLKIERETLIVFTSDNGPHSESYLQDQQYDPTSFASYGPFDGIKRDCWEGGIRMPTLVQWVGTVDAHQDEQSSQSQDWMATFADAAGVPTPARCDGVSLLPRWSSDFGTAEPSDVYIEYFNGGRTPKYEDFAADRRDARRKQMQVVYHDQYKGVRYDIESADDDFEIYDIEEDAGERHNLAGTSPQFVKMQVAMKADSLRHHSPNPTAKRPYDDAAVPADESLNGPLRRLIREGSFDVVPSTIGFEEDQWTAVENLDAADIADRRGAVAWRGRVTVQSESDVRFVVPDGQRCFLRLADRHLIDADLGGQTEATVRLSAGDHAFEMVVLLDGTKADTPSLTVQGATIQ